MNQLVPRRHWQLASPKHAVDAADKTADTYGWDTVFAIRYADVNAAIAKAHASPPTFSQTESSGSRTVTASGPFGDWALTGGGAGQNVHMILPVSALTFDDSSAPPVRVFNNVGVEIELKLNFVPQPEPEPDLGVWHELKVIMPDGGSNITVAVLDLIYSGSDMDGLTRGTIIGLLSDWLNNPENLEQFNHVFASVNLNAKADVDQFQWLKPTHVSYAVADQDTLESGIFAVLCMTDGRSAEGLFHQVSPNAIPEDKKSAFLISHERFLAKMLLPGIGLMFTDPSGGQDRSWPHNHFAMSDDDTAISNSRPVYIASMDFSRKGDGSDCYRADIKAEHFNVRMQDTYLEIEFVNLYHKYIHFMLHLDVQHTIRTRSVARLTKDGKFDLVPGPQGYVGEHTVIVRKTDAAAWIELSILALTMFAALFGMVRAGYLVAEGGELAEGAEAAEALGEGALVAENAGSDADAAAMETEEAEMVLGNAGRFRRFYNYCGQLRTAFKGTIFARVFKYGGYILTAEEVLELIAGRTSKYELPRFDDFAASIMEPVKWPDAADYTVESVAFNGSLHVVGDAGFTGTD